MFPGNDNKSSHRKVQAEEVTSLRARDVQHVTATGIDVGLAEEVPATELHALHGHVKPVQRERFHTTRWFFVFIVILLAIAAVLGFQLL